MIKSDKEILEQTIGEVKYRIIWNQVQLKSIDKQLEERGGLKTNQDQFSFERTKNELLNDIESNERVLDILLDMLKETFSKKKYDKSKSSN